MTLVVVSGALAAKPGNGGNAWSRLSFLLGFRNLGFDVVFAERADGVTPEGRRFLADVTAAYGIDALLLEEGAGADVVGEADLVLNIGGHLPPHLRRGAAACVYLDDDPVYTQYWLAAGLLGERLADHAAFYSYGVNIGRGADVPTDGIEWRPLRPPVALAEWPPVAAEPQRFTTVASWRGGYGRLQVGDRLYGQKAHEFRKLAELPSRVSQRLEIALAIDAADAHDLELLRARGWIVVDPLDVARTPAAYRDYLQGSGGEFSPAQSAYVETRSGWFSDRSAHYLAAGKPIVVQDTGAVAAGPGVLTFRTADEARDALRRVAEDYPTHSAAARAHAEAEHAADVVLRPLVEAVLP